MLSLKRFYKKTLRSGPTTVRDHKLALLCLDMSELKGLGKIEVLHGSIVASI